MNNYLNYAIGRNHLLISAEKRPLKRRLIKQLQEHQIQNSRSIGDILIDIGVYEEISSFLPLLKHNEVNWILDLPYNLTRLITNNRTIETAVERASKIVFALKNYTRQDQGGEKQLMQIRDGIETVLQIYYNQLKSNIQVIREYQPIPEIWCYPDELMQVWTNHIHNGIQAMKGKGTLTIAIYQEKELAKVAITDKGCGIPLEVQGKIFVVILDSLKEQLKRQFSDRYIYEMAESAEEAWEVIEELEEDKIEIMVIVIVCDWLMPEAKGDEFLIQIHQRFPNLITVMLTGQADEYAISSTQQQANLYACLHKPGTEEELYQIITSALG